jgi:hypothetical protein
MLKIGNKRCLDCLKIPSFNYKSEKTPIYCYDHRHNNMINVVSTRCKTHLCDIIVGDKYNGYCIYCFSQLFPEKCFNYKTKQQCVYDFIKQTFNELTLVYDKKIEDGCSLRRVDLYLDIGFQIIIIENDENQHIYYNCENKRLMEISKDFNHRPIIFIRFNPDSYFKDGFKIPSCWITTKKKGLIKIKNMSEWNDRLGVLKNEINYWINNKSDKIIHIVKLFFDD